MEAGPDGARWLAQAVRRRRAAMHLSQEDFATRARIGVQTVRMIEKGQQAGYQPRTLAAIDQALGWRLGSAEDVLTGGEPATVLDLLEARRPVGLGLDVDGLTDEQVEAVRTVIRAMKGEPA